MELVHGVPGERSSFWEGYDGTTFLYTAPNLTKRRSPASRVTTVDEDRIAVLRQATEKRPIRHVVAAHEHTSKEREHDPDVERALVIGDD